MGLDFAHPVGLAAGFDKSARAYRSLLRLGFSHVEIGTVTPKPQPGNPKPRLFRLRQDRAVINRFGFNNDGLDRVRRRLENRDPTDGVVGANIGCNKDSDDRLADYRTCFDGLYDLADYVTVNVSSPNTADLRALQAAEPLRQLLGGLLDRRAGKPGSPKPLLVKIAPDLGPADEEVIARVVTDLGVDGVILTNTTIARPPLLDRQASEPGGLSGRPLFEPATAMLRRMRLRLDDRVTLIAVGGVEDAATASAKREAGADLVQLYTSFIFQGPRVVQRVAGGLEAAAKRRFWDHDQN